MNIHFIKHLVILIVIGIAGSLILNWLSPADVQGSIADTSLKAFTWGMKLAFFSLGLKFLFGFLNFSEIFEKAAAEPGQKAIATAIMVLAYSIAIFGY